MKLHSNDLQVAVKHQETQQCTNKGREEEDCQEVNPDACLKFMMEVDLKDTVVRNTERKQKLC